MCRLFNKMMQRKCNKICPTWFDFSSRVCGTMLIVKEIYPRSEENVTSFIQEKERKPQSGWHSQLRVSKYFCIQLHIYKFGTTYGLGTMQERNFRHRRIFKNSLRRRYCETQSIEFCTFMQTYLSYTITQCLYLSKWLLFEARYFEIGNVCNPLLTLLVRG